MKKVLCVLFCGLVLFYSQAALADLDEEMVRSYYEQSVEEILSDVPYEFVDGFQLIDMINSDHENVVVLYYNNNGVQSKAYAIVVREVFNRSDVKLLLFKVGDGAMTDMAFYGSDEFLTFGLCGMPSLEVGLKNISSIRHRTMHCSPEVEPDRVVRMVDRFKTKYSLYF